jgi:hypothetical protein
MQWTHKRANHSWGWFSVALTSSQTRACPRPTVSDRCYPVWTLEAIQLGKANVNTISRAIVYFFTTSLLYSDPLASESHTASIDLGQSFSVLASPNFSAAHVRFHVYVWPARQPLLPVSVETRTVCSDTRNTQGNRGLIMM